jgi:signal transduction histidine kinase
VTYAIERNRREGELRERTRQLKLLTRIFRHDVRTEISVIRGNTQLVLEDEDLSPEGRERLDVVVSASTHADGVIETAREYVESTFGDEDVDLEPVSLRDVLSAAVRNAEATFEAARFEFEAVGSGTEVLADDLLS